MHAYEPTFFVPPLSPPLLRPPPPNEILPTGKMHEYPGVEASRRGHRRPAGGGQRVRVRPEGSNEHVPLEAPTPPRRQDSQRPRGPREDPPEGDAARAVRPRRARHGNHGELLRESPSVCCEIFFFVFVFIVCHLVPLAEKRPHGWMPSLSARHCMRGSVPSYNNVACGYVVRIPLSVRQFAHTLGRLLQLDYSVRKRVCCRHRTPRYVSDVTLFSRHCGVIEL